MTCHPGAGTTAGPTTSATTTSPEPVTMSNAATSHTVTVSFVVDGAADAADAERIIAEYLDEAATLLPRTDIPAVYVDGAALVGDTAGEG